MTLCNVRLSLLFALIVLSVPFASANGTHPSPATASSAAANAAANLTKPRWSELSPAQQQALAPLTLEWEQLSENGKKKWIEIANRYATMKPAEQQRLQERMREWVKLTPDQRRAARENYAHATQLKPENKSAQWQQYQQLTEEEKKRLAEQHQNKKNLTNLVPESIKNPQVIAPIKVGPKTVASNKTSISGPKNNAITNVPATPATPAAVAPPVAGPAAATPAVLPPADTSVSASNAATNQAVTK